MQGYGPESYGERNAEEFDDWHHDRHQLSDSVAVLTELAAAGSVLELGVGTGRIAIPLSERVADVHGIDVSPQMFERFKQKPGSERVTFHLADFAQDIPSGPFSLAFAAVSTFFALPSQDAQLGCFERVVDRLIPGGLFVIECVSPAAFGPERRHVGLLRQELDRVVLETRVHDPENQTVSTQRVAIGSAGISLSPAVLRYCWPSELDLMARCAGAQLLHRWGDWRRTPFGEGSSRHISVYETPLT